ETGTFADSSKLASRARRRAPDTPTGSPAPPSSTSVPSNAKRTPLTHAWLSPRPRSRIRTFHANRTHVTRTLHADATRIARRTPMLAHRNPARVPRPGSCFTPKPRKVVSDQHGHISQAGSQESHGELHASLGYPPL